MIDFNKKIKTFGDQTAFIPVPSREKGPTLAGWPDIGPEKMTEIDYRMKLLDGNIAINCGEKSGGIISIDCADHEFLQEFLDLNPSFRETTLTKAKRGGNLWLRLAEGSEIPKVIKIKSLDDEDLGEIRGTGGCTVVHGVHPDGMIYELRQEFPPIYMALKDVNWPSRVKDPSAEKTIRDLTKAFGQPISDGNLNEGSLTAFFNTENRIIYAEKSFHSYDESTGIWCPLEEESLKGEISKYVSAAISMQEEEFREGLHRKNKDSFHKGCVSYLKGLAAKKFPNNQYRMITCKDGVLELNEELGFIVKLKHSPKNFLRNFHPFHFTEDEPKSFLEFLENNLDEGELDLLHKIIGMLLFGGNPLQKIVLFHGAAGSGKSVLVNLICKLIGYENYAELRTEHLGTRFEKSNYLGKKLLVGSDVPEDFLSREPARHCKALVGKDPLSCEKKNANGSIPLQGNFGCLISSNHSLRFPQNDDRGAWVRRLVRFEFPNAFQGKKEVGLADKLIAEEGDAIFSWAVRGRELLQQDLNECGELFMNEKQKERVQRIADQSCTVSNFVEKRLVAENATTDATTTKEMHEEYSKFCLSDNLTMEPELVFSKELKSVFESTENVRASNSILDSSGKKVRGYRGVKIKGN